MDGKEIIFRLGEMIEEQFHIQLQYTNQSDTTGSPRGYLVGMPENTITIAWNPLIPGDRSGGKSRILTQRQE